MSERTQTLQKRLEETRAYLNTVLDQVGERWDTPVYSDGLQWTVRQLVHHLASADSGHKNQAMNIAEGRDIIPEDFDIERYNASVTRKTADKTVEQSRMELEANRKEIMDWLFVMDEALLDKQGRHASLQVMTVEGILYNTANHELLHAQDIARVLEIESEAPTL
ncbi:MAG: hypothetical protein OHK0046_40250 [Anaerolineae bacterium]